MAFSAGTKTILTLLLIIFVIYGVVRKPKEEDGIVDWKSDMGITENSFQKSHVESKKQDPAYTLNINPNKTIIIILAAFRSGSTYLGSIFDANPHIQYLMEPFHSEHMKNLDRRGAILGARSDHTEADWRMLYLQQMLHNCTLYQTPFPGKHNWCGTKAEHLHRFNTTECDRNQWVNGLSQQAICRYRKITVIKVIRLTDLTELLKIANIKSADIKIIHLLRHPVALMMSRKTQRFFFDWNKKTKIEGDKSIDAIPQRRIKVAWEVYNYCSENLRSTDFIENNPWFAARYMRVTHRDMSLKPLEMAEKVYDFIGETMIDKVREHIYNITGAQSEGYLNRRPEALNIFRNSTDVITHWKKITGHYVQYWDIFSIEDQCKRLFGHLDQPFTVDSVSRNYKTTRDIHADLDEYSD